LEGQEIELPCKRTLVAAEIGQPFVERSHIGLCVFDVIGRDAGVPIQRSALRTLVE
jgi:hypothetical protein